MKSGVANRDLAAAFELIADGVSAARAAGLEPADVDEATLQVRCLEQLTAMVAALLVDHQDAIQGSEVFRKNGHHSARVMVKHDGRVSGAEAARRDQVRNALADLPDIKAAYEAGDISTCAVRELARTWANPRVRDAFIANESRHLGAATSRSHKDLQAHLTRWTQRIDEDGSLSDTERHHGNRRFRLHQDFDKSWHLSGGLGTLMGAQIDQIFKMYVRAELLADWEKARAEHGDDACREHLPRTSAQRSADALWQVFQDAVSKPPGSNGPRFVCNIVVDHETAQREHAKLHGHPVPPVDPNRASFRCEAIDGVPVNPTEAFAAAAAGGELRRVIFGAKSAVIDLGEARFYTGLTRHAAKLASTHCDWPGCDIAVSECQNDHLRRSADGGPTTTRNNGNFCGNHNRLKENGFTVFRDTETGEIHVHRPDGKRIH